MDGAGVPVPGFYALWPAPVLAVPGQAADSVSVYHGDDGYTCGSQQHGFLLHQLRRV